MQDDTERDARLRNDATPLPPSAVASVVDAMRGGAPWRRALEDAAVASGVEQALESIASEACGNWVWLTSFDRHDAALDVGGAISSMAPALSRHFAVVHHVESSALLAEFAARRFGQDRLTNVVVSRGAATALPFREETFDCVALHGTLPGTRQGDPSTTTQRVLAECRRVLRPGGRLYAAFANPFWYAGATDRTTRRRTDRTIVSSARAAGFRQLDRYYAFPTFDRPRVIVPGTRRASLAREIVEARGTIRRVMRLATAFFGLYAVLSPSVVVIARK